MEIAFCQFSYLTQPNTRSDTGQQSEREQLTSLGDTGKQMAIRLAQLFRKASPSFKHKGKDLTPISMAFEAGKHLPFTNNRHFTEMTYFSYVKQVNRIICLSFLLVKALLAAYKMMAGSFLTRNLKSIFSAIHSFPAGLPHFPVFCLCEAVKRHETGK